MPTNCPTCFAGLAPALPCNFRRARATARTALRPVAVQEPRASSSAMDAIPEQIKLNAVAESLARSRDVQAALDVTAELKRSGGSLQPRTRAAIVDAIASSPGPAAAERIAQLFSGCPPRGFGGVAIPREPPKILASKNPTEETLPDAGRRLDMSLAAGFLFVVGSALSAEVVEPLVLHHAATEATTVLLLVMGGLAFDRFAASGAWWNRLSAGMERLLSEDPVREANVEAAHFLVAYLLGLSCAPFRPNVPQLLKLHDPPEKAKRKSAVRDADQSSRREEPRGEQLSRDVQTPADVPPDDAIVSATPAKLAVKLPPLDDAAVDRYLIWLLAGVAAEAMMDGLLVESDAARARALLRAAGSGADNSRLLEAYTRARQMLTRHQVVHAKLAQNMLEGLSAGECINLLDREFSRL